MVCNRTAATALYSVCELHEDLHEKIFHSETFKHSTKLKQYLKTVLKYFIIFVISIIKWLKTLEKYD